jgi:hypothetical protein
MSGKMKSTLILKNAAVGAAFGLILPIVIGVVLGGILQLAPCYGGASSRSFAERTVGGMLFGAMAAAYFALPLIIVGSVIGGIVGLVRSFLACPAQSD